MSDFHNSIRESTIWMVARVGVSLTVGAFITAYIIRSLTIEDYGIYTLLYSLIGYISVISSFGIPYVFQRFIPEAFQRKEYSLVRSLVFRGLLLRLMLTIFTVGIVFLFHGPIGRLLNVEGWVGYLGVFAWGIVVYLEIGLLTSVLHSLFLHKYSVIASTLYAVFRGASVFVLLRFGWGIQGVLWAEVAAWGLWLLLLLFFYYKKFAQLHSGGGKTSLPLRRYFRYGSLSSLNELGASVLAVSTDFFVITAFLGPTAVAHYAFADRVVMLLISCMPHIVLIDVIRPSFFSKYTQSGNKQHLADMFSLLLKIGAFCVFPLVAGIFALSDKMIAIVFKPEYLVAQPILWIIIISTAIGVYSAPTWLVLQALEKIQINFYSKIFAVYNLVAELLVIQRFGVIGVVLVTCSAAIMRDIFCYYFAKKYAGLSMDWRGLSTITLNAASMALVLWLLRPLATDLSSLAMVASAGMAVYLLASWGNKAFSTQERDWINRVAPRPLFVF